MKLIGLTGTASSGKDTVTSIICKQYGMQSLSTSDFVRALTRYTFNHNHKDNPVRDQLYEVGNFIRAELHPATTVKFCLFKAKQLGMEKVLVTGLRSMGEANAIRAAGGLLLAVDAEPKIRFARMHKRARDQETLKTYEQFLQQDTHENYGLANHGDERGIHFLIEHADATIRNDGTLSELKKTVISTLEAYAL